MTTLEIKFSDGDLDCLAAMIASRLSASQMQAEQPVKLLWSEKETAGILGVSPHFLKKARQDGYVTSHTTVRPILYSWEQIQQVKAWLAKRSEE